MSISMGTSKEPRFMLLTTDHGSGACGHRIHTPLTQPRPLKELGHQNVVKLFCKLALQQEFVIFALLQYFAAPPKIKFKRC